MLTLENQVCGLEYSKRLRQLGVKQESYFVWEAGYEDPYIRDYNDIKNNLHFHSDFYFSAFTVAELGEILPEEVASFKVKNDWKCGITLEVDCELVKVSDTEANARAKMLIYLIENDHISDEWKKQWLN
jgi:hypothetical protein